MQHTPKPHEIYRHFKGNLYQIITIAKHSQTGEQLVVYQAMYGDFQIYARPLETFMEKVDGEKYPDALQAYRFEAVNVGQSQANDSVIGNHMDKREIRVGTDNAIADAAAPDNGMETISGKKESGIAGEAEELNLDPMVLEFLDASTYEDRLNILAGLHHRITDDMINVMAMATDIEVKPGDVEERYVELRNCLLKLEKFECNRLR